MEQRVSSRSQIGQEGGARGRLLPIRKPTPLPADDVHDCVSHGTKTAAQIARELFGGERGDRLQNPVVGPAVVLVEQLNVIFSHRADPSSGRILPCPGYAANSDSVAFVVIVPGTPWRARALHFSLCRSQSSNMALINVAVAYGFVREFKRAAPKSVGSMSRHPPSHLTVTLEKSNLAFRPSNTDKRLRR